MTSAEAALFEAMLKKLRRGLLVLALGFVVLFCLRLGYGYLAQPNGPPEASPAASPVQFETDKHNYASSKLERKRGEGAAVTVDQKYERIAQASMSSRDFGGDAERLRELIAQYHGLVQFEERSGLEGRRILRLAIGVDPRKFDALVEEVTQIGQLASIHVHKVDKTNDYRELQASRAALVATRDALIALKGQGGRVEELMSLEKSILEHEERIQSLGVQLGEFDEENEFCTVKVSLAEEVAAAATHISLVHRAKVALEWTLVSYLQLLASALAGSLLLLVLLALAQRFRVLQRLLAQGDGATADALAP